MDLPNYSVRCHSDGFTIRERDHGDVITFGIKDQGTAHRVCRLLNTAYDKGEAKGKADTEAL